MEVARTLSELSEASAALRPGFSRGRGSALSLVPTMGALHKGHCALVEAARNAGGPVVASIYVNPLQFLPNEDLDRYPRQEAADLIILAQAGCDLVWLPDTATMYPAGHATEIAVAGPAQLWEGVLRPGHFRGVATVVAKLMGQVGAERVFFGEKDWQQLQVVRRMVADLNLPVEICGVPTVREPDGLAMSSRNAYLTREERELAPSLYATLTDAKEKLQTNRSVGLVCEAARKTLVTFGFEVDYFDVVDPDGLNPLPSLDRPARLIAAVRLGSVRLLDNLAVAAL